MTAALKIAKEWQTKPGTGDGGSQEVVAGGEEVPYQPELERQHIGGSTDGVAAVRRAAVLTAIAGPLLPAAPVAHAATIPTMTGKVDPTFAHPLAQTRSVDSVNHTNLNAFTAAPPADRQATLKVANEWQSSPTRARADLARLTKDQKRRFTTPTHALTTTPGQAHALAESS